MTEEPLWKKRLRAWSDRPTGLEPEEARRRVLRRIARRPAARTHRRWLASATALAASALLVIVLLFNSDRRRDEAPADDVQASVIVLELRSGSTLYLTTREISR